MEIKDYKKDVFIPVGIIFNSPDDIRNLKVILNYCKLKFTGSTKQFIYDLYNSIDLHMNKRENI